MNSCLPLLWFKSQGPLVSHSRFGRCGKGPWRASGAAVLSALLFALSTFIILTSPISDYLQIPMGPGNETPLKISQNGVVFPLSPQCFTFFVPRVLLPNGKKQTSATAFFHQNSAKNSNGNFSETKHLLIQAFSNHPS